MPSSTFFVENRIVGRSNLVLLSAFLVYYSLWVLALPFVDGSPDWLRLVVHRLFPLPASVALGIPAGMGLATLLTLLARAYYLVRKDRGEEEEARKRRQ